MALSALTVWELRTTGDDNNGGGFVTGATGTDFSQQDAAQFSGTDLAATSATGSAPVVTSASHNFVATDVGNLINIRAGTNWTVGIYQIVSVASNAATLDKACASVASPTAGTWAEGGAKKSLSTATVNATNGNKFWVKSGTYSITSALTNGTANGCCTAPASTGSNTAFIRGYQTSRGDDTGTRPLFQASAISTFTFITSSGSLWVINMEFDGATLTASKAIGASGFIAENCIFRNFVGGATAGNGGTWAIGCLYTGCTTVNPANGNNILFCVFKGNTITPWVSTTGGAAIGCVFDSNTGTTDSASLQASSIMVNCTAYNQGRDNFRVLGANGAVAACQLINCLAFGTNGTSLNLNGVAANASFQHILNCAADTYSTNTSSLNKMGSVTLSADPFTAKATSNFSLNATAGGGVSARAAGYPATFAGGSVTAHLDIGAIQHGDPTQPAAANVLTGVTYNDGGTTGTLTLAAAADVFTGVVFGVGGTSVTGTLTLPVAGHLLTGDTVGRGGTSVVGTLTLPVASHVLNDQTYGVAGTGSTGTLTLPTNSHVLNDQTYGIGGSGSTGTLTLPVAADVFTGITYGVGGSGLTGTLTLPSAGHLLTGDTVGRGGTSVAGTLTLPTASHVLNDQTYGASGNGSTGTLTLPVSSHVLSDQTYGIGGNGTTGSLTLPTASHVLNDQTYGVAGNGSVGTLTLPLASKVIFGIGFGIGGASTGTVTQPAVADVLNGVQYGAGGTEFTGTASGSGGTTPMNQTSVFSA